MYILKWRQPWVDWILQHLWLQVTLKRLVITNLKTAHRIDFFAASDAYCHRIFENVSICKTSPTSTIRNNSCCCTINYLSFRDLNTLQTEERIRFTSWCLTFDQWTNIQVAFYPVLASVRTNTRVKRTGCSSWKRISIKNQVLLG